MIDPVGILPAGRNGPLFDAPWQAQIFAMVVALHERGLFPWQAFQSLLIETIADAAQHEQGAEFYYRHWLRAAERLLHRLDLVGDAEIAARTRDVTAAANAAAHRHD